MNRSAQVDYIKENYLKKPVKTMANDIGRSPSFVYGVFKRNNLERSDELIAEFRKSSHFKKGHKTWNKGMQQSEFMTKESIERSKKNRFKSGNKPHNELHDLAVTLRQDKPNRQYYYIRIAKGSWQLLHRYIWEIHNGPIPRGFNIQFKDGDTHNTSIDNLYMINRNKQAIVNKAGGKSIPYELRETILLINELKKKFNEKQNNRPQ